jgi:hypothetical protein
VQIGKRGGLSLRGGVVLLEQRQMDLAWSVVVIMDSGGSSGESDWVYKVMVCRVRSKATDDGTVK